MEYINNFLSSISIEGLSKNTIDSYKRDLKQVLDYFNSKKKSLLKLEREDLVEYIEGLNSEYSTRSIARKISAIKHFYDFLQLEKIIMNNPSTLLQQKKIKEKLPNVLNEIEINKIISEAKKDTSDYGIKFYTMVELLYASGMRVSELVELTMSNFEKEFNLKNDNFTLKPFIKVVGKGNKTRIIPINYSCVEALTKYLILREKLLNGQESKWIFTTKVIFSKNKDKKTIQKIGKKDDFTSRQVFARYLKDISIKAGVDPTKLSPHTIRHTVATLLLKNNANLRFIQEFLGHSDISTTQIYTHLDSKTKKEAIEKYHPFSDKNMKSK